MNIMEKIEKILELGYVCDHCLGRQFAQLLVGFSNNERGKILRKAFAMEIDAKESFGKVDPTNFYGIKFHSEKLRKRNIKEPEKCVVCNGLFKRIEEIVEKARKAMKKYEFNSFLVGTKLSWDLLKNEEELWERVGVDFCEPIKGEINREVGKRLEKIFKRKANLKNPDIVVLIDLKNNKVDVQLNPLFIYGEYQKLVREIPQTKWPSGKYKISIEQIIAKPIIKATRGKSHKFHGMGREDIDARCLGWRPFVLEILEPKKRFLNLKKIEKEINKGKKVKVRNLKYCSINEVRKIKEAKPEKTYQIKVICSREITKDDLKKIRSLAGKTIIQRTPIRVSHRRADKIRRRKVVSIKVKKIGKKELLLTIRAESGFYVKEFITGDKGRTKPSIAEVLNCECKPKDLDVLKVHFKKSEIFK